MSRGRWALVTLGLLSHATPAAAFQLSEQAEVAFAQAEWLFGIGTLVLILGAAFALRAVMRRPPGARSWEAAFVVMGLGLVICIWFVVCVALYSYVLLPG
jgi:hypothetical protein